MKWTKPKEQVDFKGTQLGELLSGLEAVKGLLEAQLKGYESDLGKAQMELAKYELQASNRKVGGMKNGK